MDRAQLEQLSRPELQALAKRFKLKANQKSSDLVSSILSIAEAAEEFSSTFERLSLTRIDSPPAHPPLPPKTAILPVTPAPMPKITLKQAMVEERTRRRKSSAQSWEQAESKNVSAESANLSPCKAGRAANQWERVESKTKPGLYYYWNPETKTASWQVPS